MIAYCPYELCPGRTLGGTCCADECFNADHQHIMNDPNRRPKNPVFYQNENPLWNTTLDELLEQRKKTAVAEAYTTTAAPEVKEPEPLLCPFRKNTYFYSWSDNAPISVEITHAEFCEEEFQPCMMGRCMFYRPFGPDGPTCGHK